MLGIDQWLAHLPGAVIYLVVGAIILAESMGIPLPGEITLVSASLLATTGVTSIEGVAVAAATGAVIGDSLGYTIGRRGGRALLERIGRRFPRHLGPVHLDRAERIFEQWGVWAVFLGRFVALLRILAGPLAGALRVPYRRFLAANAAGGVVWAFGTALVVYYVGRAAERYLNGFSWIALLGAVAVGTATTLVLRHRAARANAPRDLGHRRANRSRVAASVDEVAPVAVGAVPGTTAVAGTAAALAATSEKRSSRSRSGRPNRRRPKRPPRPRRG